MYSSVWMSRGHWCNVAVPSQTLWWRPWPRTSSRSWPRWRAARGRCRWGSSPRWSASCRPPPTRSLLDCVRWVAVCMCVCVCDEAKSIIFNQSMNGSRVYTMKTDVPIAWMMQSLRNVCKYYLTWSLKPVKVWSYKICCRLTFPFTFRALSRCCPKWLTISTFIQRESNDNILLTDRTDLNSESFTS